MKKKLAKARQPKVRKPQARKPEPGKARPAAAAAPPPEPYGDGADALSIEAMLRAQMVETHLAAMDCLHRARTADSPETRHQALTHATRLLSLFTRQVKTLEHTPSLGRAAPPARALVKQTMGTDEQEAHATVKTPADDPACVATLLYGDGRTPPPQAAVAGGGP
jgi:hypothetical protein